MFKYVKNSLSYYFVANDDGEEDNKSQDTASPTTEASKDNGLKTEETEHTQTMCDKYTQTDNTLTNGVYEANLSVPIDEKLTTLVSQATTQTDTYGVESLLNDILKEVDDNLKKELCTNAAEESSDSNFMSSDDDQTADNIDINNSYAKYKKDKPSPLSYKKEQYLKEEAYVSPTYSETIKMAEKKSTGLDLFSIQGSSTISDIKINPDMLKLLETTKEEDYSSSDNEEEERNFMTTQRRSIRLRNQQMTKTNSEINPKCPTPCPTPSNPLFQSQNPLKIKLPPINATISPRKIPPNPPKASSYNPQSQQRYPLRNRKNKNKNKNKKTF